VNGQFVPGLDTREPQTLANCTREGRDPTTVGIDPEGLNVIQQSSVEIASGGSLELEPETSSSFTVGAAFAETFRGRVNVSLGINYYNITVKQSIIEPSSQFILNDCFAREDEARSAFCDRITVGTTPQSRGLVSEVFAGFINLDEEKVRGIDLNGFIGTDTSLFGRRLDLGLNLRANHLIERSSTFVGDDGNVDFDEDQGEFGYPKWTGRATFTAEIDKKWLFTWQTRYIGPVEQQDDFIDPLSDVFGRGPDGLPTGFLSDTCTGGGSTNGNVPGDGVFCRDVGYAGKYFLHTASVRYRAAAWEARVGITNLFNRKPPEVDGNEVFAISNVPIGNGYDLDGREFFASVKYRF
jgi:iron complex outermembrane receptor protein